MRNLGDAEGLLSRASAISSRVIEHAAPLPMNATSKVGGVIIVIK
ncbi:Uncharacterised protein [Mycobacterium tuberculosis]|uniref:Uncharacterized protein n=1 Tax=Mycobacterium tuberculosis TaxID=1773 RepID=A0A0U0UGP0_MYCTX|nr:Uncharacterised protein [Mycobacterium tuberculosis]CFE80830.1 Uncharacterised protein [Mycobacterium tuberculosis]CFR64579.1 Uncharacterised protein [Mycobacterium tuberculosis]CFS61934.1 Uncharacterised protein [Mycobacterium tuberculosis]CKR58766.1 Uncharacterised protein [Mycobacterium tuberculosis]